ncbi:MAG: NosD domain-containing protein [Candidatus Bathyarchaeota archaeon]|jgi:parallel beta-helix repeat protein
MKNAAVVLVGLLFLSAILVSLPQIETVKAEARTIVVPDDYSNIFLAIENANDGDTVFVKRGNYEGPINQTLLINKTISVIGENPKTTKLFLHPEWVTVTIITADLSHYAEPIRIEASNVSISGLTINSDGGEISANGDRAIITGNIFGVSVALSGSHQLFTENTLIDENVHCWGTYASVSKNTICNGSIGSDSGSYDKIFANNVTGSIAIIGTSNYELVYDNTVKDGSGTGISIGSSGTTIANNTISNCSIGIAHHVGSNSYVHGNVITNNRGPALKVEECSNLTFAQNYVADNPVGIQTCTSFLLFQNSFVNNDVQLEILDDKIYFWEMDSGEIGNYWSDYTGKDADGDGIGDSPYSIGNQILDNYPLMEPVRIIPEFPLWVILQVTIVAVLVLAAIYRMKLHKWWEH